MMDYETIWCDLKVTLDEINKFSNNVNIIKILDFMSGLEKEVKNDAK